jgi:uncharacterized membrane protein
MKKYPNKLSSTYQKWDVFLTFLISISLIILIFFIQQVEIRAALGLIFTLVIPGYLITLCLFPTVNELYPIERLGYSIGISIAIVSVVSFLLAIIVSFLSLVQVLSAMIVLNSGLGLLALKIRSGTKNPYVPTVPVQLKWLNNMTRLNKSIFFIFIVFAICAAVILASVSLPVKQEESVTNFYLVNNNITNALPHEIIKNVTYSIGIGIQNLEKPTVHYYVEIWIVNLSVENNALSVNKLYYYTLLSFNSSQFLQTGSNNYFTMEYSYNLTVGIVGQYKLWLILYQDTVPSLPHAPQQYDDFSKTSAVSRISDSIDNKYQSLTFNLNITQ